MEVEEEGDDVGHCFKDAVIYKNALGRRKVYGMRDDQRKGGLMINK